MRTITILLSAVLCLPAAFAAEGTFPVEGGFLSVDLDQLTLVEEKEGGVDLVYRQSHHGLVLLVHWFIRGAGR